MANPLLVFSHSIIPCNEESVCGVLENIDTALTDCRSLVLYTRKIWPDAKRDVFTFVRPSLMYPKNVLCNRDRFEDVWQTGTAKMPYAGKHLKHYTSNALTSHAFIKHTLPAITQFPIFAYSQKDATILHFSLDAPPLFTGDHGNVPIRPEFTLKYTTGYITGLNGQGIVHKMYGSKVRAYFADDGGVESMAILLYDENIGSVMRYDNSVESWRLFCARTGIWKLPKVNEEYSVGTTFLKKILLHIYLGPH